MQWNWNFKTFLSDNSKSGKKLKFKPHLENKRFKGKKVSGQSREMANCKNLFLFHNSIKVAT